MSRRSSGNEERGQERGNKFLSLNGGVLRTMGNAIVFHSFVRRTCFCSERNSFPRVLAMIVAGLLLAALPVVAKPKFVPTNPNFVPIPTAVINNSGSTNTVGYAIEISSTGDIRYHTGAELPLGPRVPFGPVHRLPKLQTKKLFHDLVAAMPLTRLPVRHGMRSASFGTRTTITYKGQTSPDLTFASDPCSVALKSDIDAITKKLPVVNVPYPQVIMIKGNPAHTHR
jgi:hypothetical protein